MSRPDDFKFDRYPKAAQRYIETLEAKVNVQALWVEEWKTRALGQDDPEANTFLSLGIGEERSLGKSPTIRFRLPTTDRRWRQYIDMRITSKGRLQVMGGDSYRIYPQSTNFIELEFWR